MDVGAPYWTPNISKLPNLSYVAVFAIVRASPMRCAVRLTTNLGVVGSNPARCANFLNDLAHYTRPSGAVGNLKKS